MITLSVNTDSREVQAVLRRLRRDLQGGAAARVVAEAGADVTRGHLFGLAAARHRRGQPQNFYARAADSVVARALADGAEITVPHTGLALRYYGGTVRPSGRVSLVTGRPIRRLAVPIPGKGAEGKTPAEFDGLFMIRSKGGNALLAGRKANGMVGLLFMLLPKTEHRPDKGVLPGDDEYRSAAAEALTLLLEETHGR